MEILLETGLRCKTDKCELGVALGHVLPEEEVKMWEDRKSAVMAMPFLRSCYKLHRFLGIANYMRCFIPKYSTMARPLYSMMN